MLFLRYYLWVAPHILLSVMLAFGWRRGWRKRLPFFFCFVVFQLLQFLALFTLSQVVGPSSVGIYRWAFVVGFGIANLLELGVLFELSSELLLSRMSLAGTLRPLLNWILAALLLLAAAASAGFSAIGLQSATRVFETVDFISDFAQVGLLLSLFIFSRIFHISWRSWPTGIALGFGIWACINLAAAALRSGLGVSAFIAVDITQMAAFHVSVVVWLIYLFLPDETPASSPNTFSESEIQFWDQQLQRMTGQ
jgi:hypothetical protein